MDAPRDAICVPCGHVAGCYACLVRQVEAYNYLSKHRNGETAHVELTFQGQFTLYLKLASEAYAAGVQR